MYSSNPCVSISKILFAVAWPVAFSACIGGGTDGAPTTSDATACCLCLLQTGPGDTSITVDPSSTDALDDNCVQGAAVFQDENVQCSTEASQQVVSGASAAPVQVEAAACAEHCADDCVGFSLSAGPDLDAGVDAG